MNRNHKLKLQATTYSGFDYGTQLTAVELSYGQRQWPNSSACDQTSSDLAVHRCFRAEGCPDQSSSLWSWGPGPQLVVRMFSVAISGRTLQGATASTAKNFVCHMGRYPSGKWPLQWPMAYACFLVSWECIMSCISSQDILCGWSLLIPQSTNIWTQWDG